MRRAAAALGLLAWAAGTSAGEPPHRIAVLAPHLAELVCAAGVCERLVAASAWSDYPASVKTLPQVIDGYTLNYEALLALKPDLVIAWDGGTPTATIARLRELGLRVEPLRVDGLDGVAEALDRLGEQLGTAPAAHAAAEAYRARLAMLRARWKEATPVRVVYQLGTSPAYSLSARSPISAALQLCGGVNVFADLPGIAAPVGAEAMLAAQPQLVLFAGDEDNSAAMRAYWARLPGAPAQRLGMIRAVNGSWLGRPGPRLLDGVQQVCERLDEARLALAAKP